MPQTFRHYNIFLKIKNTMISQATILVVVSESLANIGVSFIDNQFGYVVLSIIIAIGVFFIAKLIIQHKLDQLKGSSKFLGLISVAIVGVEIIYLGVNFGIFTLAIEFIAYLGIGLWIILIPFQSYLKNMASGISNYMNTEIDIGDIIEIKGKRGVIVEFHLTKTILVTENGERVSVPNHKFAESVVVILPKTSRALEKGIFKN